MEPRSRGGQRIFRFSFVLSPRQTPFSQHRSGKKHLLLRVLLHQLSFCCSWVFLYEIINTEVGQIEPVSSPASVLAVPVDLLLQKAISLFGKEGSSG